MKSAVFAFFALLSINSQAMCALAIDPEAWEQVGEEKRLGTKIDFPEFLVGEVISGNFLDITGLARVELEGKVISVKEAAVREFVLETSEGRQNVLVTGARKVKVLKSKTELKNMGIPAVDGLPLGTRKS